MNYVQLCNLVSFFTEISGYNILYFKINILIRKAMSIYVKTDNPQELVSKIRVNIDKKVIDTWSYDKDGDFTHDVDQWRYRAWIRPHIKQEKVIFAIVCRKDRNMSITEYAVYHGRFVEMLLVHFDELCKDISVTPLGSSYDVIDSQSETV